MNFDFVNVTIRLADEISELHLLNELAKRQR